MIEEISFDTILSIWKNKLWQKRPSIDSHSAMLIEPGKYDFGNFLLPIWYFGLFENNKIIGVNSCHLCVDGSMRSRGLWVDNIFRGRGYGKMLLLYAINKAQHCDSNFIWSFPRKTAWPTYNSVGFVLTSDWQASETSDANTFCRLSLK